MAEAPVIVVKNLTKKFGNVLANYEINFSVNRGEIFCVAGPDGAGKTTLIRQIAGSIKPTEGTIHIFDVDIQHNFDEVKRKIGYVSQNFSHYTDLTVRENLEFFAEIHQIQNFSEKYEKLIKFAKLENFQNVLVGNLSGGMKQKLALICAMIYDPEVLLLDEPTTGVDPISRREFWFLLSSLVKSGKTILLSTPYLDEAERVNRVALLNQGKILVCDSPKNLIEKFNSDFDVFEIVGKGLSESIDLFKNKYEIQLFGDRINVVMPKSERNLSELNEFIKGVGLPEVEIERISPRLENVFISLIKN